MHLTILMSLFTISVCTAGASVVVGSPGNSNNCLPFDCPTLASITHYQQLYAPADFGGPLTIMGVTFFVTIFQNPISDAQSTGTYTLSLSTVSAMVGSFTSLIAVGADNTQIYSGSLPSVSFGGSFTLGGGSFAYNPVLGSLLLDVRISGAGSFSPVSLDARDNATGIFGRATNGTNTGTTGLGLVTRFETAAPEPSSLVYGMLGLVMFLGARKRLVRLQGNGRR
jgi:hypothetical protein